MSDLHISKLRSWIVTSPPVEFLLQQAREIAIGALSQGPIPRHVAFVMDGNRRYARSHKIETVAGHHLGFEALARVLEVCYRCGVKVVTVYAFSIENFNRPKYEVDGLMELARVKLEQLAQHGELLERYGASVRVLGARDLIRKDVLDVIDRAVDTTKHNKKAILNICFPYTSREEITQSIRETVKEYSQPPRPQTTPFSQTRIKQKILSKHLDSHGDALASIRETSPSPPTQRESYAAVAAADPEPEGSVSSTTTLSPGSPGAVSSDTASTSAAAGSGSSSNPNIAIYPNPETITTATLTSHMYTADNPPLDLFVRTSGVERLSDFMLWQCHEETQIFFIDCLWPEFDLWHFLPVLVEWQWRQKQRERDEKPRRRRMKQT